MFDAIIWGTITAIAAGKVPATTAIKLGTTATAAAARNPESKTAKNSAALTIVPVTNCWPNSGAIAAAPVNAAVITKSFLILIDIEFAIYLSSNVKILMSNKIPSPNVKMKYKSHLSFELWA
jgi:hypothetical protein